MNKYATLVTEWAVPLTTGQQLLRELEAEWRAQQAEAPAQARAVAEAKAAELEAQPDAQDLFAELASLIPGVRSAEGADLLYERLDRACFGAAKTDDEAAIAPRLSKRQGRELIRSLVARERALGIPTVTDAELAADWAAPPPPVVLAEPEAASAEEASDWAYQKALEDGEGESRATQLAGRAYSEFLVRDLKGVPARRAASTKVRPRYAS